MKTLARRFGFTDALSALAVRAVPVLFAITAMACSDPHGGNVVEVMSDQCSTCHNYNAVQDPNHIQMGFALLCNNCHYNDFWRPALGENAPHPDQTFRITAGPHKEFECVDCHDPELGSSLMGQNTDCIGCHTGTHSLDRMVRKHLDVEDFPANSADVTSALCLECHPNGRDDS